MSRETSLSGEEVACTPDLTVKSAATPDFLLENLPETFIDWEDEAGDGRGKEAGEGRREEDGARERSLTTTEIGVPVLQPTSFGAVEQV